jgi:PilZ domain
MGRRSEQRIVIAFPVVIRGTDSRGSPFAVTTETHDISCTGASLKGLQGVAEPGRKIEIECQNQKAWYRVQWAAKSTRRNEWRVGVRCLEPGKYIWGVPPKEWQPDTFELMDSEAQASASSGSSATAIAPSPPRERRRFARHQCRLEVQVIAQGAYGEVQVKGKIIDVSLGGCYVEMLSPLPSDTPVELAFTADHTALRLSGKVCTSQEGFGMGVGFTGMTPDDFEALRQFAPPTKDLRRSAPSNAANETASRGSTPQKTEPRFELRSSPSAAGLSAMDIPEPSIAIEALVRLLLRKGVVTRAELVEELERLKATQT